MMRPLCILLILGLFVACDRTRVAGTDDVQDTGSLSALIRTEGNAPAAGAEITLRPADYNARIDAPLPERWKIVTGLDGKADIDSIPEGDFDLEGFDRVTGARVLIQEIPIEGNVLTQGFIGILKPSGNITLQTKNLGVKAGDYVFLPGTSRFHIIDSADLDSGRVVLDSVPAGIFSDLRFAAPVSGTARNIIAQELEVVPGQTVEAVPFTDWKQVRHVLINTSGTGAGVTEDLHGYPILVRLSSTNFDFATAQKDGSDLRFAKTDGTPLPHEIEYWDSTSGRADVWVRLDSLRGGTASQSILMYSGNPAAGSASSGPAVFESPEGWQGLWHAASRLPTDTLHYPDASGYGNVALSGQNPIGLDTISPTTRAVRLNGVDQFLFGEKLSEIPTTFTLSLWMRTNTTAGGRLLLLADANFAAESRYTDPIFAMGPDGIVHFSVYNDKPGSQGNQNLVSTAAYNDNQWHLLTAVLSPAGQFLYVDGKKVGQKPPVYADPAEQYSGYWSVGHYRRLKLSTGQPNPAAQFFKGDVDEIHIRKTAESEAWVKMNFESQKPGSGVVRVTE